MTKNRLGFNLGGLKNTSEWETLIDFMIKNNLELPATGQYKLANNDVVFWVNPNEILEAKRRV